MLYDTQNSCEVVLQRHLLDQQSGNSVNRQSIIYQACGKSIFNQQHSRLVVLLRQPAVAGPFVRLKCCGGPFCCCCCSDQWDLNLTSICNDLAGTS
jgi:hypothetical protein